MRACASGRNIHSHNVPMRVRKCVCVHIRVCKERERQKDNVCFRHHACMLCLCVFCCRLSVGPGKPIADLIWRRAQCSGDDRQLGISLWSCACRLGGMRKGPQVCVPPRSSLTRSLAQSETTHTDTHRYTHTHTHTHNGLHSCHNTLLLSHAHTLAL